MVRPRLIALDLDETLLDLDSRLPAANRRAVDHAIAEGIEIVIATGRAYDTIPAELRCYPGIRYAITGNGAAVYDMTAGTAVSRQVLPEDASARILALLRGEDVQYEVFVAGKAYAQIDYLNTLEGFMMDAHLCAYVRNTRTPVENIFDFIQSHRDELDSLAVIPRNLEVKRRVTAQLHTVGEVYITTSAPRLVEINHRDCTKAAGLRFLAERLGVPREQTAAFGNGDNDAEMLAWSGWGVSVAEGTPMCRESADYVTGSYLAAGVADAFGKLWNL